MRQKFGCGLFMTLILLMCLAPSAGMLLGERQGTGGNEALSSVPALYGRDGSLNREYLPQLMDYIEDSYWLRQEMITAWSALNAAVLRTSITPDVVLGGDGWLYFGETLTDYAGVRPLEEGEVYAAARNLALMAEYCQNQGARFLFTTAPNKNSLYPDHMPALTVQPGQRSAQLLAAALEKEGVAYLDLFQLLGGQEETLYFAWDSHWNAKGAALAADGINAALGRSSAYFAGPFTPSAEHRGDLYNMLYPAGRALETDQTYEGTLAFTYDAPIRSAENLTIMTSGSGEGSLLLFRDSFGNLLYPYLADSWGQALFSRSMPYRLHLTAQRGAECVVVELVERNLRYLVQNVPVMPAPLRPEPAGAAPGPAVPMEAVPAGDELPGLVLVTGRLPEDADGSAPLYFSTPAGCYEAFLLEEGGFGLYVPETALAGASVVYESGGRAVRGAGPWPAALPAF